MHSSLKSAVESALAHVTPDSRIVARVIDSAEAAGLPYDLGVLSEHYNHRTGSYRPSWDQPVEETNAEYVERKEAARAEWRARTERQA